MKSIVENISKEIVCAAEGVTAGIVTNVFVDEKMARVRGYKALDDEREDVRLLPLRRLLGEGDALVVKNLSALTETSFRECPLGAKIYDTCGMAHGTLRDLLFDEVSGKVLSVVADESEIAPERVVSFGSKTVVLRAPMHENTLFRKSSSKKKKRAPSKPLEEAHLPAEQQPEAVISLLEPTSETSEIESEDRGFIFQNYAFLLGRRIRKDIASDGVLVASANEVVTPEIIFRAHQSGKLVELTVNSRK